MIYDGTLSVWKQHGKGNIFTADQCANKLIPGS